MSVVIVDNGSKYTSALLKLLRHDVPRVISYKELDYRQLSTNDIVVLTGGHGDPILWHKKQYAKEIELVKKHKGPVIGICLGFELIAHTYGSHLHLLNERRKGEVKLTSINPSSIVIPKSVQVYENHNWSVPKLKRPLQSLAVSSDGIEIFKHSRRQLYGMQLHPEESSTAAISVFMAIMDAAKASLKKTAKF